MPRKEAPPKCSRIKNPCKICFETVTEKTGLQCKGACKKWAHYKCLNYTPGKILDIQSGYIQVNCPCPNCATNRKEYQLKNLPRFCGKPKCPASKIPVCQNKGCPSKKPGLKKRCPEDCTDSVKGEESNSTTLSSELHLICKKVSPLSSATGFTTQTSGSTLVISLPETPTTTDSELPPKRNAPCQKEIKRLHKKHKTRTRKCAATQLNRIPQRETSPKRNDANIECKVDCRDKEVYVDCYFRDQCTLKDNFNEQLASVDPSVQSCPFNGADAESNIVFQIEKSTYTTATSIPRNCRSVNMQSNQTCYEFGQNSTESDKCAGLGPNYCEKSCQPSLLPVQNCPQPALTSTVILSIGSLESKDGRDIDLHSSDYSSSNTRNTIKHAMDCMCETVENIQHQIKGVLKKMFNAFETTSRSSCS